MRERLPIIFIVIFIMFGLNVSGLACICNPPQPPFPCYTCQGGEWVCENAFPCCCSGRSCKDCEKCNESTLFCENNCNCGACDEKTGDCVYTCQDCLDNCACPGCCAPGDDEDCSSGGVCPMSAGSQIAGGGNPMSFNNPGFVKDGEFKYHETDISIPLPGMSVNIARTYGSRHEHSGSLGYGWDLNYNMKILRFRNNNEEIILFFNGRNRVIKYTQDGVYPEKFINPSRPGEYFQYYSGQTYPFILHKKDKTQYKFNTDWKISKIEDKNGYYIEFEYSNGRLWKVEKPDDNTIITLSYNGNNLLTKVADVANREWTYYYDGSNNLTMVVTPGTADYPNGLTTTYLYDDVNNLAYIYNADNKLIVANEYYNNSISKQIRGGGYYDVTLEPGSAKTTIIANDDYKTELFYNDKGQTTQKIIYTTDLQSSFTTAYSYDSQSNRMTRILFPLGNCIDYTYNDDGMMTGEYKKTDIYQPNTRDDEDVIATTYTYNATFKDEVATEIDAIGNTKTYAYDSSGFLTKVTYPDTSTEQYLYNASGQMTQKISADGIATDYYYDATPGYLTMIIADSTEMDLTTRYAYDSIGRQTMTINPKGQTTFYYYDNLNQLTKETSPAGYDTCYNYDASGNRLTVTRVKSGGNQVTSYTYTATDKISTITDPLSHSTSYVYNDNDQLQLLIDAEGNTATTNYNERGLVTSQINAEGATTQYYYDNNGNLTKITDPAIKDTVYSYDSFDRKTKVTDARGNYVIYSLDKLGRVTKQIHYDVGPNPDVAMMQTRNEYNSMGRLIQQAVMDSPSSTSAVAVATDRVVDYIYDITGRLTEQINYYNGNNAATTTYSYDRVGRQTRIDDPAGNYTIYSYDTASRVMRVQQVDVGTNNLTKTIDYEYDAIGRTTKQIEKPDTEDQGTWLSTYYYYNELGNLIKQTNPRSIDTTFDYDIAGNLLTKIEDQGESKINRKTEYVYDKLNRLTKLTGYADGSTAQNTVYMYDKVGSVTKIQYPDTKTITYLYNPSGRVSKRTDQRGIETTYFYDNNYNLLTKDVDGKSIIDNAKEIYTYDALNRMLSADKDVEQTNISQIDFDYDAFSNIITSGQKLFGGTEREVIYSYDQAGTVTKTHYPVGVDIKITPDWRGRIDTLVYYDGSNNYTMAEYDYIGGQVARRGYPTADPDVICDYAYDNLGRITHLHAAIGETDLVKFNYNYQASSYNIQTMEYAHRPTSISNVFYYDNLDRLTKTDYGVDSSDEVFTLDKLGNRDLVNPRSGSNIDYEIDNTTNRYTKVGGEIMAYDYAGNLTANIDYNYEYDYENRPVKVSISSDPLAEYSYDALGRRIRFINYYDPYGGGNATTTQYYYSNNWQVLEERNGEDSFQMWYAYGNYIDELLMRNAAATGTGGCLMFLHDHLYSPVRLISTGGYTMECYEYDAYGNPVIYGWGEDNIWLTEDDEIQPYSAHENRYLFTGREVDLLNGGTWKIQYNRNRYYDYYTGRWLSQDPIGYQDGWNLYEYVNNNPILNLDPSGTEKAETCPTGTGSGNRRPYDPSECPCPSRRNTTQCCADAKKITSSDGSSGKKTLGAMFCCDGKKVLCSFVSFPKNVNSVTEYSILEGCVIEHEKLHCSQTEDCSSLCPSFHAPGSIDDPKSNECEALRATVKCLNNGLSLCKTRYCQTFIQEYIDAMLRKIKELKCP